METAQSANSRNILQAFSYHFRHSPAKTAFILLGDDGSEVSSLTYEQLEQDVRKCTVFLQRTYPARSRVALIFQPCLEFITAFLGCLYANMIPVPTSPAVSFKGTALKRMLEIIKDSEPQCILTSLELKKALDTTESNLQRIAIESLLASSPLAQDAATEDPGQAGADDIAFLQYTSGSTSMPKGVMVSYGNLLDNMQHIGNSMKLNAQTVVVSWLPVFHDMGLIAVILTTLHLGAQCILMRPVTFLRRPFRWLEAISKYRGTVSHFPCFALDLCVRKITTDEKKTLDLSSWRIAGNAAEPIRAASVVTFTNAFKECGFRPQAHFPGYGLAEATLVVADNTQYSPASIIQISKRQLAQNILAEPDTDSNDVMELVSCGTHFPGHEVAIVDPATCKPCPPGCIGEIWLKSASVAKGYWRNEEATRQTFFAYTTAPKNGPYLATGDLGAFKNGQLFITGRLKDLIIINGRNLYPQDIEYLAESVHPMVRKGCVAAFSVDSADGECITLVAELEKQLDASAYAEICAHLRREVSKEFFIQVKTVILIGRGTIPKTTSGKIQRRACKENLLKAELSFLHQA